MLRDRGKNKEREKTQLSEMDGFVHFIASPFGFQFLKMFSSFQGFAAATLAITCQARLYHKSIGSSAAAQPW